MGKISRQWLIAVLLMGLVSGAIAQEVSRKDVSRPVLNASEPIVLDASKPGRTFEGLGALSAGASSRLLIDYPESQRSEILDFLFKPNFGASLQHLKVEIGGDVNSGCGTEPSIARTREEFEHPKPEYFNRGYEWWLMKEAKKRNPAIIFNVLQWGAPGWIGGRKFYTQDNTDFIATFIKGAKKYHDLDISYCGIWNEKRYDVAWIKLLRQTLNKAGLEQVKIVAADEVRTWTIADKMAADPELRDAVQVIGTHYPHFSSTPTALSFGKPVWASEDGPGDGNWNTKRTPLASSFNRNYVIGKMTTTVHWSPITSYFDILPFPGSGLMRAVQPWSGHYEVQPAIWITAHTTQFIQPGWKYLDDACRLLPGGGSSVAAVSPDGKSFSIVVETKDAKKPKNLAFRLAGGLACDRLHVWRSTAQEQFIRQPDVSVTGGTFQLAVEPDAIYSLTTTEGQQKGLTTIPPAVPLPLPYREDFSTYPIGRTPRWISDYIGAFETAVSSDGRPCLRQVISSPGISWWGDPHPITLVGDLAWKDYEVTCDVWMDFKKFTEVYGRISGVEFGHVPLGYVLRLGADGDWRLFVHRKTTAEGPGGKKKLQYVFDRLAEGRETLKPGAWCRLGLRFVGDKIVVLIDGREVGAVSDPTFGQGYVALGCGYEPVQFTNLSVTEMNTGQTSGGATKK